MHFNLLDLAVLVYVGMSVFIGRRNGLAAELPWAVSWAVALFTGSGLYHWTSKGLFSLSEATGNTVGLIGFLAIVVGAYVVVRRLRSRIKLMAEEKFPDEKTQKRWGAVVGGLRGLLLCGFLILFISLLPIGPLRKPFTEGSFAGRVMMAIARPVYDLTHERESSRPPSTNHPPRSAPGHDPSSKHF
jgi:hypothetical protein